MAETRSIIGHKYLYKISISRFYNKYYFTVFAVDKVSKRTSVINTINPLLGELRIDLNDDRFWESDWLLTNEEMISISEKVKNILVDKEYLIYFENYLDKDRNEGEWERGET